MYCVRCNRIRRPRSLAWIDLLLALENLWGRSVDLVKPHLLDPVIRDEVLEEAQPIYVAPS